MTAQVRRVERAKKGRKGALNLPFSPLYALFTYNFSLRACAGVCPYALVAWLPLLPYTLLSPIKTNVSNSARVMNLTQLTILSIFSAFSFSMINLTICFCGAKETDGCYRSVSTM